MSKRKSGFPKSKGGSFNIIVPAGQLTLGGGLPVINICVVGLPPTKILDAALFYAASGHTVFPAPPGEKKSHKSKEHSGGINWGATSDQVQIRKDFRRWPNANIGLPTGSGSGFFVVEADTKEGHDVDGIASLEALQEKHGRLPPTRIARSPSGSMHYYFKYPEGSAISNSSSKIAAGVDVRAEGGMVIAPPSVRPGKGRYEWVEWQDIAEPPDWMVELCKGMRASKTPPPDWLTALLEADAGKGLSTEPEDNWSPISPEKISAALDAIPNDDKVGWDDWNNVALAIYAEFDGDSEGYELFRRWSEKSPKYNEANTAERWKTIGTSPPDRTGAGALFKQAERASPGWEVRWNERRRAEQIAQNIKIGDDVAEPIFPTIMTLAEMEDRLVFIGSNGGVVDRATGRVRKKDHAAAEYAASIYQYVTKDGTQKKVPALKLWIESPQRLTVDVLTWVPGSAQICPPPEPIDGARTAFNTWRGMIPIAAPPEDWQTRAEHFIDHVEYLVPIKEERRRFLQWLAHIVQRPEVLPHTIYLMTTQMTGIGRNLMASIIVRALRGHVAAGISLPNLLDSSFNGRLSQKLLAIVDEAKEGSGERRYQRAEQLKSMTTTEYRHINPKYGVESIEKNCCRWLMFSNHRDALPFDNTDRRVIVIANPTQRKKPEYYERLFNLLDDIRFIASVRHWLEMLDIADFRPGEIAPMNEAKKTAIREMMSETERAVSEFKEECKSELTSRSIIRDRVKDCIKDTVNETHLTHAIARAGMTNAGHRVRIDKVLQSIVIVRGDWTSESVKKLSGERLTEIIKASEPPM